MGWVGGWVACSCGVSHKKPSLNLCMPGDLAAPQECIKGYGTQSSVLCGEHLGKGSLLQSVISCHVTVDVHKSVWWHQVTMQNPDIAILWGSFTGELVIERCQCNCKCLKAANRILEIKVECVGTNFAELHEDSF